MFFNKARQTLTDEIIGSDENTAEEKYGWSDAVVHSKHHVVDDSFVNQVAHLHEPCNRGHQPQHRHLDFL